MNICYCTATKNNVYHDLFAEVLRGFGRVKVVNDYRDVNRPDKYDVIFVEGTSLNAVRATHLKKPKKLIIRTSGVEVYEGILTRLDWNNVDLFLAYTNYQLDYFRKRWNSCKPKEVGVLTPIVAQDRFTLKKQSSDGKRVALISNITGRKGIQTIPDFLKLYPDFHIYHLGKICAYGHPIVDYVNFRIGRDKTSSRYHWDKWMDNKQIPEWLDKMDFIWLASVQEGFNRGLLEGMSKGLTPIIRNWGGAKEVWPEWALYDDLRDIKPMLEKPRELQDMRDFVISRYSKAKIAKDAEQYIKC